MKRGGWEMYTQNKLERDWPTIKSLSQSIFNGRCCYKVYLRLDRKVKVGMFSLWGNDMMTLSWST